MPLATDAPWSVNTTFLDRDGNKSTSTIYYDQALAYDAVATAAGTLYTAMTNISDAQIVAQTISRNFEDPDLIDAPPETSDVERKLLLTFRDSDRRAVSVTIPSVRNTLVVDGTNVVDPANVAVSAFVTALVGTGVTSRGLDIIKLDKARKVHRRSSEG